MKSYLVGGAVRDTLLGLAVKDRDWVIVGATPEHMLSQGFQQVGADFPVFLHPETHEEYALARTERKSGQGYKGFEVNFSTTVTLEDDLLRRDLTINAMAQDEHGNIVDPYHGRQDIEDKVLRHVSPAFREDPLRVLRVARFAARFDHLGFSIADETLALMQEIAQSGELDTLVPERVWQEIQRALTERSPWVFWQVLRQVRALDILVPELNRLFGIPQTQKWHPEVDTGIHTMMVLKQACTLSQDPIVRYGALCHDLGKGLTPSEILPRHHGHEETGERLVKALGKRLKVPNAYQSLAAKVARYHTHCHRIRELKASTIVDTLQAFGAYQNPLVFENFLLCCTADFQGRSGWQSRAYPQADYFHRAYLASRTVDTQALMDAGYHGKQLGEEIRRQRINRVKQEKISWQPS
ncbi:multifunctional CCA addition/repair protein [Gynuella sunshinyii]|nr:multifunctional CCA addition/repair protein [Gynuella sunshinyii]